MHLQDLQLQNRELQESLRTYANSLYITDTEVVTRDGLTYLYSAHQDKEAAGYLGSFFKWTVTSNQESQNAIAAFITRHITLLQRTYEKPFTEVSTNELAQAEQNEQLLQRIIMVSKEKFSDKYGALPHYTNPLQDKIADCAETIANDRGVATLIPYMKEGIYVEDERMDLVCDAAAKASRFVQKSNVSQSFKRLQAIARGYHLTRMIDQKLKPFYPNDSIPRILQFRQEIKTAVNYERTQKLRRLSDSLTTLHSFAGFFPAIRKEIGAFRGATNIKLEDLPSDIWGIIYSHALRVEEILNVDIDNVQILSDDIFNLYFGHPQFYGCLGTHERRITISEIENMKNRVLPKLLNDFLRDGARYSDAKFLRFRELEQNVQILFSLIEKVTTFNPLANLRPNQENGLMTSLESIGGGAIQFFKLAHLVLNSKITGRPI